MSRFNRWTQRLFFTITTLLVSAMAKANLPTAVQPPNYSDGDWLSLIRGYVGDGLTIAGIAVSAVGFIWVAWTGLTKFNEARQGKAEWGEVGLLGLAGAAVLLFITFLLTQADGVIT